MLGYDAVTLGDMHDILIVGGETTMFLLNVRNQ